MLTPLSSSRKQINTIVLNNSINKILEMYFKQRHNLQITNCKLMCIIRNVVYEIY